MDSTIITKELQGLVGNYLLPETRDAFTSKKTAIFQIKTPTSKAYTPSHPTVYVCLFSLIVSNTFQQNLS